MIEAFFQIHLHASLRNARWSWGAVRAVDGAVFLRVWQDEKIRRESSWYMRLTAHKFFADKEHNLGWQERLAHVKLVQGGAPSYMVMCEARTLQHPFEKFGVSTTTTFSSAAKWSSTKVTSGWR